MTKGFEDFPVYQKAISLTKEVFLLLSKKELNNELAINYQLKKAVLSISNNIAEGSEYNNNKQFIRFLWIAKGSCAETKNMIIILKELKLINEEMENDLKEKCENISKEIYSFIQYLNKFDNQSNKLKK